MLDIMGYWKFSWPGPRGGEAGGSSPWFCRAPCWDSREPRGLAWRWNGMCGAQRRSLHAVVSVKEKVGTMTSEPRRALTRSWRDCGTRCPEEGLWVKAVSERVNWVTSSTFRLIIKVQGWWNPASVPLVTRYWSWILLGALTPVCFSLGKASLILFH